MNAYRTVLEADLAPLAGSLIQPTGFPDLGAAEFGDNRLLVESAQSMANWLESTTWDSARNDQVADLSPLPYVRIISPDGAFLSSSRLEAHRLASAYVMEGKIGTVGGEKWMEERLGLVKGKPLDNRAVARACFKLDPVSLVHGIFFARKSWPWQPKIARAVTSFIEASGVKPAVSGGVKRTLSSTRPGRAIPPRDTAPSRTTGWSTRRTRSPPTSRSITHSSGLTACPSRRPGCSRRWRTSRSRHCSTGACGCAPAATWS
jgi:CRISPR-associated protein Csb1